MTTPPPRHSALATRHSGPRVGRGLGVIEMLTVLAVLVIGLGMIVVTARHVRASSANELTRKRMRGLVEAASTLINRGIDPTLPLAADQPNSGSAAGSANRSTEAHEALLADFARRSSRHLAARLTDVGQQGGATAALLEVGIGVGVVGPPELVDAWDRPIALLPRPDAAIGMAPDDGPFFVSAGPDGRFLTLADNIYSYDLPALLPALPTRPTTRPAAAGGQDE